MNFWVDNVRYTIEDCDTKTILDLLKQILDKGVSVYSSELDSRLTDAEAKIKKNTSNIDTNTTDISEALTRITTAENDITELGNDLNETNANVTALTNEVTAARGGSANLDARLDAMTTATSNAASAASAAQTAAEAAQSDATSAQNTANEAAANANTANYNIAAATGSFDSLAARLYDMDTNISNVTDDTSANTISINSINNQISSASSGFDNLSSAIKASEFLGFGKTLSPASKQMWINYVYGVTNYYTAAGNETTSGDPEAVYTIRKISNRPTGLIISIANILTVTSDMLLSSSLPAITVDGVLYTVFFIRLPNIEFKDTMLNTVYLSTFPAIIGPSDPTQITMDMIGNTNSTGTIGLTSGNAALYIPVLRPSTSPGTVFKFLYTAIDPDTNTVQYLTYNSQITVIL